MERKIEVKHDPVVSGYGSAAAIVRPWFVLVDGKPLADAQGRMRRFSSEGAARAAANRAAGVLA